MGIWVGAAIRLLCRDTDPETQARFGALCAKSHRFALNCQDAIVGGFAKWPSVLMAASPDPLHTYLGLSGMALFGDHPDDLLPTNAALNVTERAHTRLLEINANRRS